MNKFQCTLFTAVVLIGALMPAGALMAGQAPALPPNILFIIMDDVGIDQMRSFGYGGIAPPAMPNINQLAGNGIRFRNNWSMPACTPSRAVFFEGRFPLRTNVLGALGPNDLANSMVSPYEMTTPKLLSQRNYQSALFGKFHLGLQGNNPFAYGMPAALGWNYYYGWLDETGDPSSIDTTAGGVGSPGEYPCGFVPGKRHGGADFGACYTPYDQQCTVLSTANPLDPNPPGRACLSKGGVFEPKASCKRQPPTTINFSLLNAHYVSPLVINHENGSVEQAPLTDKRSRTFRGVAPVDAAITWINSRPKNAPWMATVSFATVHTPLQQAPYALLPNGVVDTNGFTCTATSAQWAVLSDQMIAAMDEEIGRLLLQTGLASGANGALQYHPESTGTMIVLVGDNGTLGYTVKPPFDPTRAKGTAYQTGVWVPLIVAGPLVNQPNRDVTKMTNIADIYQLFGEMAGINVEKSVTRPFDSVSMLPYLLNPQQEGLRSWNYTEVGTNLQANGTLNGPCQFSGSCSQIPVTKGVCEDNGGAWWGPGAVSPQTQLTYCCQVQQYLYNKTKTQPATPITILPLTSVAIRNAGYKLVRNSVNNYDAGSNACVESQTDEFYQINENAPLPLLDTQGSNLLVNGSPSSLNQLQLDNYNYLEGTLAAYKNSVVPCHGDGNLDLLVNLKDVANWATFTANGLSSWYDINLDGLTNAADRALIRANLGMDCKTSGAPAP